MARTFTPPRPEMGVAEASEIYRHIALFDLVQDVRIGLNLAFYRTFAVPRIAELLVHTGEFHRRPHKRSIDTGLFIYELIEAGYDTPRGEQIVRGLNRMHERWDIEAEDYLYVLNSLIVVPTRWINNYGARNLTQAELDATVGFYYELGLRMKIASPPTSYAEGAALFDDYEARNVAYSDAGKKLMYETRNVLAEQLPWLLKPAGQVLTWLVLDDYVAKAVGLPPAPKVGKLLVFGVGLARIAVNPFRPKRTTSYFQPGRKVNGVYPNGYQFDELGVTR